MKNNFDWIEDCYQTYKKDWLENAKFKKAAVTEGNHYHCLFDAKKLSQYNYDNSDKQGYYSDDDCIWLCESCFREIQKHHKLPIIKNTVKMIADALSEYKTIVFSLENKQYILKNNFEKITIEHNGVIKEYDSILTMEREQLFYGKHLRDIIDEIFIGII